jgi:hypothetical protein
MATEVSIFFFCVRWHLSSNVGKISFPFATIDKRRRTFQAWTSLLSLDELSTHGFRANSPWEAVSFLGSEAFKTIL